MDISNYYSNYLQSQSTEKYTNAKSSMNVSSDSSDDELMEACKSFEAYFMEKIYKSMMDTTKLFSDDKDKSDTYASKMVDYFKDTAIGAMTSASQEQGGIGIAKELYNQMKLQYSGINPSSIE